jgi:hypothetical protein
VGLATATQAKADPSLRPGDPIGQSGLQAASDAVLRGKPSGELTLVDSAGHTVATLARWAGRDPVAVSSTPRSRMLVAGAELFRDRGFDGTGFREIVNRAGAAVRRLIGIAERIMFEPDLRPGYPVAAVTLAADDPDGQLRTTCGPRPRERAALRDPGRRLGRGLTAPLPSPGEPSTPPGRRPRPPGAPERNPPDLSDVRVRPIH